MHYRQLSEEDRCMIATMRTWGWSVADIAREVGRHRSTVYREVARNCAKADGWYGGPLAAEKTRGRRSRSRRNLHYGPEHFVPIEAMLRADFSPEQIVGRLALEGVKAMSHETIYRWIWADKKRGGTLWRHLRGARKQRRKRYGRYDSRGRLAGKRLIGERPAEVKDRKRFGDWEIDTVHGRGKPCVVTVVERKSGLTRIGKLPTASGKDTLERTTEIMAGEPHPIRTITADNGTEFHIYKELEGRLGAQVFFATPHHAWERGTNENTNGLLRQYLPRGTSLHNLRQPQCDKIAEKLNNRPRLRHGFYTPNEVYYGIHDPARDWAASCGKLFAPVLGSGPIAETIPVTIGVALQS
jgi:transposase, IS30 family